MALPMTMLIKLLVDTITVEILWFYTLLIEFEINYFINYQVISFFFSRWSNQAGVVHVGLMAKICGA